MTLVVLAELSDPIVLSEVDVATVAMPVASRQSRQARTDERSERTNSQYSMTNDTT